MMENVLTFENNSATIIYTAIVLLLPLVSFIISLLTSERYSWLVTVTSPILSLLACIASLVLLKKEYNYVPVEYNIQWFTIGEYSIEVGFHLTTTSLVMMALVAFISFLVHLYSAGYMAGDDKIQRYYAMLAFFTFAMQGIVLSNDLILLFFFWEWVGFASYMLIGHWTDKTENAVAARKAFIINRVGDVGFLIGIFILTIQSGTSNIHTIITTDIDQTWMTLGALSIFLGVIGKSAQFPLSIWLPDAMRGPTPVSALMHAATMVAAGVYVMISIYPVFTPFAKQIIGTTGAITAWYGALCACHQFDIKRILAYSTISQLGLMVMGIATSNPEGTFMHLYTHAFFKAGLFLAAGSVIYALHAAYARSHQHDIDVQDLRNMGGLRKNMPLTSLASIICAASLAGVPFSSGFLSKENLLNHVWQMFSNSGDNNFTTIMLVSFIGVSVVTAFYSFRMIWYLFLRKPIDSTVQVDESPAIMRFPLLLLAIGSTWIVVSANPLSINSYFTVNPVSSSFIILTIALVITGVSIITAFLLYRHKPISGIALFTNGFYLDATYNLFIFLIQKVSHAVINIDKKAIDGIIHLSAYGHITLAHITRWIDKYIVDGFVHAVAWLAQLTGSFTRSFQGGKIQHYIFWAVFGLIIFLISSLV